MEEEGSASSSAISILASQLQVSSLVNSSFFLVKHEWQSCCYRLGVSENYSYAKTVIMTNSVDMMVTTSKKKPSSQVQLTFNIKQLY